MQELADYRQGGSIWPESVIFKGLQTKQTKQYVHGQNCTGLQTLKYILCDTSQIVC